MCSFWEIVLFLQLRKCSIAGFGTTQVFGRDDGFVSRAAIFTGKRPPTEPSEWMQRAKDYRDSVELVEIASTRALLQHGRSYDRAARFVIIDQLWMKAQFSV